MRKPVILSEQEKAIVERVRKNPGKTRQVYQVSNRKLGALCGEDGPLRKLRPRRWGMPRRYTLRKKG